MYIQNLAVNQKCIKKICKSAQIMWLKVSNVVRSVNIKWNLDTVEMVFIKVFF